MLRGREVKTGASAGYKQLVKDPLDGAGRKCLPKWKAIKARANSESGCFVNCSDKTRHYPAPKLREHKRKDTMSNSNDKRPQTAGNEKRSGPETGSCLDRSSHRGRYMKKGEKVEQGKRGFISRGVL